MFLLSQAGIKMSHSSTTALCRAMKLQCELYPSRHVALCLDPYCGLGFALWCLSSVRCDQIFFSEERNIFKLTNHNATNIKCTKYLQVYSGHHTILIPPSEVEANPGLWLTAVSQFKVRAA